jgi:hypothetical protein
MHSWFAVGVSRHFVEGVSRHDHFAVWSVSNGTVRPVVLNDTQRLVLEELAVSHVDAAGVWQRSSDDRRCVACVSQYAAVRVLLRWQLTRRVVQMTRPAASTRVSRSL